MEEEEYFWELSYWEVLDVRHAIDVMHLTKNLCVNLLGFVGVYGKPKDTLEPWQDHETTGHLTSRKRDKGCHYLGPACYTLSKEEKQSMFDCLNSIKVLSTETHRRAMTGNTKSREVARALEALLPRRRPAISVTRPEDV